jgi:hypothetical protein
VTERAVIPLPAAVGQGARRSADAYHAGGIVYRKALAGDDASLRQVLRDNAMDSWARMSFEREPCFFQGESLLGASTAVIAHEQDAPHATVGMYSCTFLSVHVNGEPRRCGYLGGLRVNRDYRHRLGILKNGFASIRSLLPDQAGCSMWFTSVASENVRARRLLEARIPGMPVYRRIGDLATLALATSQGRSRGLLRRAERRDVAALAEFFNKQARAFQFSPELSESWLLALNGTQGLHLGDFWLLGDGGEVRGCLALWDQRAFKQTVARGYRFPLNLLRLPYNLFARLALAWRCPRRAPACSRHTSLSSLSTHAQRHRTGCPAEGLAKARQQNVQAGIVSLSMDNPLLDRVRANMQSLVYCSCTETVAGPTVHKPSWTASRCNRRWQYYEARSPRPIRPNMGDYRSTDGLPPRPWPYLPRERLRTLKSVSMTTRWSSFRMMTAPTRLQSPVRLLPPIAPTT